MSTFIDTEGMSNAARRMEFAAREATHAADRIEESVRQFRILTENGYGNNVSILIEQLAEIKAKET